MSDVIKVYGDANSNNNDNVKHARLPTLKKWLQPEHEGLRCDILEVALAAGVAHEHVKLKDEPANQWKKVCNGFWDREGGVFHDYEEPKGDKQLCYMKKKVMGDTLPALSKNHDHDVRSNVNPLSSFVMAKNTHDSNISMLKELSDMKKEMEQKCDKLVVDMKRVESSVGIVLGDARM